MGASTILVLDDEPHTLEALTDALEKAGYAPIGVTESDDPVAQFEALTPELVLLSLHAASALAVCERIRLTGDGAIVPIIFVGNGHRQVRSPSEALAHGGDYHFGEPLDLAKILAKVQTYVGAPIGMAARPVTSPKDTPAVPAQGSKPGLPSASPSGSTRSATSVTRPQPGSSTAPSVVELPKFEWGGGNRQTTQPGKTDLSAASDDLLAQIQAEQAEKNRALEAHARPTQTPGKPGQASGEEDSIDRETTAITALAPEALTKLHEEPVSSAIEDKEARRQTEDHTNKLPGQSSATQHAPATLQARTEEALRLDEARVAAEAEIERIAEDQRLEQQARQAADAEIALLAEERRRTDTQRANESAPLEDEAPHAEERAEERAEEERRTAEREKRWRADEARRAAATEAARIEDEARQATERAEEQRRADEREERRKLEEARQAAEAEAQHAQEERFAAQRAEYERRAEDVRRAALRAEEEHLLAEAEATRQATVREAQWRAEDERRAADAQARRLEIERRAKDAEALQHAEEERLAQRAEEARQAAQRAEEARLAAEAEAARQVDAQRRLEQARRTAELESQRLVEEQRKAVEEARRRADEEAAKFVEEQRRATAETRRRADEEAAKLVEEQRQVAEAARQRASEEAARLIEEQRKAAEEIRRRADEEAAKLAEDRRTAEADAQRAADERRKIAAEAEARRQAAEAERAAEHAQRQLEDEIRRAEAERLAAQEAREQAIADEARRRADDIARRKFGPPTAKADITTLEAAASLATPQRDDASGHADDPRRDSATASGHANDPRRDSATASGHANDPRRDSATASGHANDPRRDAATASGHANDPRRDARVSFAFDDPRPSASLSLSATAAARPGPSDPHRGQRSPFKAPTPEEGSFGPAADIADLFAELVRQQVTGRVDFTSGTRQKSLVLERGHPVDAYSSQVFDRMEEYLMREGRITRAQYNEVRVKGLRGPRRIGAYLTTEGYLKPEELFSAVRGHLEELIYSLFEWEEGAYSFVGEHVDDDDRVMLDKDPRALVVEGIRRKFLLPRALQKLGGPSSLLVRTDPEGKVDAEALGLGSDERQIARLIDGSRNIEDIVFSSGLGALRVYHTLAALVATGFAEVAVRGIEGVNANGANDLDDIDRQRILDRVEQARQADYFQILGLTRSATTYEVDVAFERITRELAPGRLSPSVRTILRNEIDEIERVLEDARDVLRDPRMREAYAKHLPG